MNNNHWVFPIHARDFHEAVGIATPFSTWIKTCIRVHHLVEGDCYWLEQEWSPESSRNRACYDLQFWIAKAIAERMKGEKRQRAFSYLADTVKEAQRRGWYLHT